MAEAKGLKLRRKAKNKGYYAAQFGRTDDNKKKRLGKHIRHFPESLIHQTQKVAEPIFGALYEKIVQGHVANRTSKAMHRIGRKIAADAKALKLRKDKAEEAMLRKQFSDRMATYLQDFGWEF